MYNNTVNLPFCVVKWTVLFYMYNNTVNLPFCVVKWTVLQRQTGRIGNRLTVNVLRRRFPLCCDLKLFYVSVHPTTPVRRGAS